jgi:5'-nucleotidase
MNALRLSFRSLSFTFLPARAARIVACAGDDTSVGVPVDGGRDATAAQDAGAPDAAASDASRPDATLADAAPDAPDAPDAAREVTVQILAFNDFHGNLRPPSPSNAVVVAKAGDPAIGDAGPPILTDAGVVDGGPLNVQISAGGASYFAAHVKRLRAANPNTVLVSAGDMTGASPLISSSYADEPTIETMNVIGVDLNGVGNHEFDHGPSELLRLQYGGCNAADRSDAGGSCVADPSFPGASFGYLAANVDVASNRTIFPPYAIKEVGGARIAFIGMTLRSTPAIVSSAGTAGLSFADEVDTVNALVPELKKQSVDAIVVLVHQGGFQLGTYDECVDFSGAAPAGTKDILSIVDNLDPAVDAVVSAHTHAAYNCVRGGRLLTSAASYGRIITQIALTVDTRSHKLTRKSAKNVVVTRDVPPDPEVDALVTKYAEAIAPIAERKVGQITADLARFAGPNGESPLGDVAADALRAATGADVGVTNIGGLRDSLLFKQYYAEGDGNVTFEKAQAVMPFANKVVMLTCTGAQLLAALQQNLYVQPGGSTRVLQVSSGLAFTWNAANADANGQSAIVAGSVMINGAPLDAAASYTVGTTDFVGAGKDGYTAFRACTMKTGFGVDLDAFTAYLGAHAPLAPPAANRITKL